MRTRVGQLLLRADLITEGQLMRALEVQSFAGGRIGTLLLERGAVAEDDLGRTLALQHGCDYIAWSRLAEIPPDTIAALPARFAIKHCAIPCAKGEGFLKVAVRDPEDLALLDELTFVTGCKILAAVAPEFRIYQALEKYFGKLRAPRYAILVERLPRTSAAAPAAPAEPPPPPEFLSERPAAPATGPVLSSFPESSRAPGWAGLVSIPPEPTSENQSIAWEDSTGKRLKTPLADPSSAVPPPPSDSSVNRQPGPILAEPQQKLETPLEVGFSDVLAAKQRDTIVQAVLAALAGRFPRAAIFSCRAEGVSGWAAAGEGTNPDALRDFRVSWDEPSVFSSSRLSRSFYKGPLPSLPRHELLASILGGWPAECVLYPVLIGERPVAFVYAAADRPGSITEADLSYLAELAAAASAAFVNAIHLKKKDI
jgi:hypothetical protein